MEHEDREDDPQLKAALKSAMGRESAPRELRDRVISAMALATMALIDAPILEPKPKTFDLKRVLRQPIGPKMAITAVFATIVVIVTIYSAVQWIQQPRIDYGPQALTASQAEMVVKLHREGMAHASAMSLAVNMEMLGKTMQAKLNLTPWMVDLRSEGWKLQSAGPVSKDGSEAMELLYQKDGTTLSILTMPATGSCGGGGLGDFQSDSGDDLIAGFTYGGGMYSMIAENGDKKNAMSLDQVAAMRDRFRNLVMPR
jgi:hypothetical protein